MKTNPDQDIQTPALHIPTESEIEHRRAQLLGLLLQTQRRPTPPPERTSEPPRASSLQPPAKPELGEAALHGPAGRIVRILSPHTEAHPAAILLQLLAAFGNLVGPGPHCMVESTRHALKLFVVLVGDSSKARKGASWSLIANLFAELDPSWLSTRVNRARLTAQGLVQALHDQQSPTDRRLLALSEEFAAVLQGLKRANGHLSPLLRCAWDGGDLPALNMHQNLRATGTHISLIAHITEQELAQTLPRTQIHNGFANRCLWTCVERANCLPEGGNPVAQELSAAVGSLRDAVSWATARPEILFRRDQEAGQLWADRYAALSYHHPGLRGAATSRGEAQVLRLSAIYAALDSSEIICLPHLEAAYAVWIYCYASATRLFGLSTGDTVADRIREAVEASRGGLTKTQIRRLFYGHVDCDRIDAALEHLTAFGALATHTQPTRGRRATLWSAGQAQPQEENQHLPEEDDSHIETDWGP
jgi:hypothetical protein